MLSRFARIPIRWRLALVSATFTFLILLAFSIVVGVITSDNRLAGFDSALKASTADLQSQLTVALEPNGNIGITGQKLDDFASPSDAMIRVISNVDGSIVSGTKNSIDLGLPTTSAHTVDGWRVVARPIFARPTNTAPGFDKPVATLQYAENIASLNSSIRQLWLLLAAGTLGGTLLALIAGRATANRAMRPIANLARTARKIGVTGDTSLRIPIPTTRDEVADLAVTLDEMLASLNSSRSELEHLLNVQKEFVADASHELRTPLTSILANLDLVLTQIDTSSEEGEIVVAAKRSTLRMRNLVSDLLVLARADTGKIKSPKDFDFAQTVRDAAGEEKSVIGDHKITLNLPEEEIILHGSSGELHRLALNLIENAIKYTPDGANIGVTLSLNGASALLAVEDSGPGIAPELRPRIFDRFVRGGAGGSDGTGLGLSIVKAVAESHGGTVTVGESSLGGAKFEVRLPLKTSEA